MSIAVLFFAVFLAGPVAYYVLVKQMRAPGELRVLAVLVVSFLVGGVMSGRLKGSGADVDLFMAVTSLLLFWCGWVALLALCTAVVNRRLESGMVKKMVFALGAVATTLPWMGWIAAEWMAG